MNYIICIIKVIKPDKIITLIDNSVDFHNVSKFFEKSNITFYALQNAVRNEIYLKEIFSIGNFNGNYFCFSDYEINAIKKNSFISPQLNLKAIGSLRTELAKEFLQNNNKDQLNQIYDICFLSEAASEIGTSGSLTKLQYEEHQKISARIFRYTQFFCKKFRKKLLFLGRHDLRNKKYEHNKEIEFLFYKYKNDVDDFKLQFFDKSKYENIKNLLQSRVIVGQMSTLLRESFGLKKKILVCDWENKEIENDFSTGDFPGGGIMKLQSNNYPDFEKRLLEILNINYDEYLSKTKDAKLIYNLDFKTLDFLREEFK